MNISSFRRNIIYIPYLLSIIIIIHHYIIHHSDKKSFTNKLFQFEDINNHETWVLFLIGIGIGMSINI